MVSAGRQKFRNGLTLIELLVMVAIIGILAVLLFPAVQGAIDKEKALRLGSKGRDIYLSLFDENILKVALKEASIYPSSDPGSSNYYATSTAFIKDSFDKGYFKNVDFSLFAASGGAVLASTNSSEFQAIHNAWCITADIGDRTPSSTPFLFTRNIKVEGNNLSGVPTLNPDEMPFGDKLAVVVTKGGEVRIITGKKFNQNFFHPTQESYPVLRP